MPTQTTDPLGNTTSFSYDPNGNLLSLSDALTHGTSWSYDNMDRVFTLTDPLQRPASFKYDPNGNLALATDRKGQVTSYSYDGFNRPISIGFNSQSTINYTLVTEFPRNGRELTSAYGGRLPIERLRLWHIAGAR